MCYPNPGTRHRHMLGVSTKDSIDKRCWPRVSAEVWPSGLASVEFPLSILSSSTYYNNYRSLGTHQCPTSTVASVASLAPAFDHPGLQNTITWANPKPKVNTITLANTTTRGSNRNWIGLQCRRWGAESFHSFLALPNAAIGRFTEATDHHRTSNYLSEERLCLTSIFSCNRLLWSVSFGELLSMLC